MNAKLISKGSRFKTNSVILPLSVKVVIAIILAFLGIFITETAHQVSIKEIFPAFLIDRIDAVPYFITKVFNNQHHANQDKIIISSI